MDLKEIAASEETNLKKILYDSIFVTIWNNIITEMEKGIVVPGIRDVGEEAVAVRGNRRECVVTDNRACWL